MIGRLKKWKRRIGQAQRLLEQLRDDYHATADAADALDRLADRLRAGPPLTPPERHDAMEVCVNASERLRAVERLVAAGKRKVDG